MEPPKKIKVDSHSFIKESAFLDQYVVTENCIISSTPYGVCYTKFEQNNLIGSQITLRPDKNVFHAFLQAYEKLFIEIAKPQGSETFIQHLDGQSVLKTTYDENGIYTAHLSNAFHSFSWCNKKVNALIFKYTVQFYLSSQLCFHKEVSCFMNRWLFHNKKEHHEALQNQLDIFGYTEKQSELNAFVLSHKATFNTKASRELLFCFLNKNSHFILQLMKTYYKYVSN